MKILRVDMSSQTLKTEEVPADIKGLGGRGLTSVLIQAEIPPLCDPLGPENKMA